MCDVNDEPDVDDEDTECLDDLLDFIITLLFSSDLIDFFVHEDDDTLNVLLIFILMLLEETEL